MKVIDNRSNSYKCLSDMNCGDCFELDGQIYIRSEEKEGDCFYCVCLNDGSLEFYADTLVSVVNVEAVIKNKRDI